MNAPEPAGAGVGGPARGATAPRRLQAGEYRRELRAGRPPTQRDPQDLALVELARDGARREWSFGEIAERSARLAGTLAQRAGVRRGDVVMTLIGNRPDWVLTMVACFRIGAVVLPCTEQLAREGPAPAHRGRPARPSSSPTSATATELATAMRTCRRRCHARWPTCPTSRLFAVRHRRRPPSSTAEDPCLITFTSGTAGEPKAVVHAQRYLDWPARAGRALAGRECGRAGLVHGRERLVEVGSQRVHRAVALGRRGAPARRALRSRGAPGAARARARATCCAWPRPSTA